MSAEQRDHPGVVSLLQRLAAAAEGAPVVLLWPRDDGAIVGFAPAAPRGSAEILQLPMPPASRILLRDPPTPGELERAIEVIEDAVMPLARRMTPAMVLVVSWAEAEAFWRSLTAQGQGTVRVSLDQVEAAFRDQSAIAEGRPASRRGLPTGTASAWQLLLLREAMHHWGFAEARLGHFVTSPKSGGHGLGTKWAQNKKPPGWVASASQLTR